MTVWRIRVQMQRIERAVIDRSAPPQAAEQTATPERDHSTVLREMNPTQRWADVAQLAAELPPLQGE